MTPADELLKWKSRCASYAAEVAALREAFKHSIKATDFYGPQAAILPARTSRLIKEANRIRDERERLIATTSVTVKSVTFGPDLAGDAEGVWFEEEN